jgi:hypothetical protein
MRGHDSGKRTAPIGSSRVCRLRENTSAREVGNCWCGAGSSGVLVLARTSNIADEAGTSLEVSKRAQQEEGTSYSSFPSLNFLSRDVHSTP